MTNRHLPTGIIQKLTRRRKNRSLRQFRPVVLGMEQRLLMASMAPASYSVHDSNGYESNSIQDAINNADSGDTVDIDPGTYAEQLTIGKSLTIEQTPNSTGTVIIQTPGTLNTDASGAQSIVTISGSGVSVDFGGLTVEGPYTGTVANPVTPNRPGLYGIFVRDGAYANIHGDTIQDIRQDPLAGNQYGVAIEVGRSFYNTTGTATIAGNVITGYQKNGITVDGAGSSAAITGNTITGAGDNMTIVQNGIQISREATATISGGNKISGNENSLPNNYGGPDLVNETQSDGILLYQAGSSTVIDSNMIFGNDVGITSNVATDSTGTLTITSNQIGVSTPNRYAGVVLDQGTTALSSNMIMGGNVGVAAISYAGNTGDTVGILNGNTISSTQAFEVDNENTGGSPTVQFTAHGNNLGGSGDNTSSNSIVTINGTVPVVDASDNYWGSVDPAIVMGRANGGNNVDYSPYQASPFDNSTLYVVGTGSQTPYVVNSGSQTGSVGRVQEGINLATPTSATPTPRVYVLPGTYTELLTINKSLLLASMGTAPVIQAPDLTGTPTAQTVVTISGKGVNAELSGITINGADSMTSTAINTDLDINGGASAYFHDGQVNGYEGNGITVDGAGSSLSLGATFINAGTPAGTSQTGIQVINGASATVNFNAITGNTAGIEVDQGTATVLNTRITNAATGIVVASTSTSTPASVTVGDGTSGNFNTITGYTQAGISASGAGASATVIGNTITGLGSNATAVQYGIEISNGALGTIGSMSSVSNDIESNQYTDASGAASAGILISQAAAATTVSYNTVNGNSIGIESTGTVSPMTISHNDINNYKAAGNIGILISSAGTATVDQNRVQGAAIAIETNSTDSSSSATISNNPIIAYDFAGSLGILNQSAGVVTIANNGISGGVGTPIVVNSTGTTMILGNAISGYGQSDPTASVSMTGIEVDNGTVTIGDGTAANSNTITGYMRTGIAVSGAKTTATIADNTITGVGSMATAGEFGISIGGGALGTVTGNTISNNLTASTHNTNSVGILLNGGANGTLADYNILDNNDVAISSGTIAGNATEIRGNMINTKSGSAGSYGISNSSAGSSLINGNVISNSVLGIVSNSSADGTNNTTTINKNTITTTSSSYTGIEIDQGTVTLGRDTITGNGRYGVIAVANVGPVVVNLMNTQINGADTGILVDSTRANGMYSATVNVTDGSSAAATTVTNAGSHGAVLSGSMSYLNPAVPPTLTVAPTTYTQNSDGTYTATFASITGSDNITSANDLVLDYSVDGVDMGTPSSPLTLTLPAGNHTVVFTVMNQSTGANKTTTQTVLLADGVGDGSFESPSVGSGPSSYVYTPTTQADPTKPNYNPWTFVGGAGISGTGSGFTSGSPSSGSSQVAFLQNGNGTMGANGSYFSQAVTFQTNGMETISFSAAQRANQGTQVQDFAVYVGGTMVGKFQPSSTAYQTFTTNPFAVTPGQTLTVSFVGIDTATGDNTAFIDNIAAAAVQPSTTPTVGDGSFEAPTVNGFSYNTPNSPWTFVGGTGIAANNSGFTGGQAAPDGTQVAFIQGGDGSMVSTDASASYFSQSVSFANGGTYVLTFSAAQRGNLSGQNQNFAVYVGTTMVGTFRPSGSGYQSFTTSSFTAAANSTLTITFVGIDAATGDNTAFVDNIKLAVAPTNPAPTVGDGSFETPSVASQPGGFQYAPPTDTNTTSATYNPWTFANGAGIASNGSAFTGSQTAPDGSHVAFIQGGNTSSFSQAISFTAGNYNLNFLTAQRNFNGATQTQDFDVLILDSAGKVVSTKTFQPGSTSYSAMSESFTIAGDGMYTIMFVGRDTAGTDNTAFIDNITIANA